jgi:predicted esterase
MPDRPEPRVEYLKARRTARCLMLGPAEAAAVRELWIVLHGYAQLAEGILAGLSVLDDGHRLLVAPEALSRFYDARGERSRHHEAPVGASWMTREDRLHEIEDYVAWLQQVYEAQVSRLPAGVPVTVLGFSQGAAAASRWVAAGGATVSHLVCWGASVAPELDLSTAGALRRARCTIVIGDRDQFIAAPKIDAERARLDAAGFPYEFVGFAGGHRLDDATLRRIAGGAA